MFVLAEVFAVPYDEIASMVGKSPAACRQIASRSRRRVRDAAAAPWVGHRPTGGGRVAGGRGLRRHAGCPRPPVPRCHMHVGRRPAPPCGTAAGRDGPRVARFLVNLGRRYAGRIDVAPVSVNGDAGYVVRVDGLLDQVLSCSVSDGRVVAVRIVRNPEKLRHVGSPVRLE